MVTTRGGSTTPTQTTTLNTTRNPANTATTTATANTAPASGANTQSSSVTLTMAQFQQLLAAVSGNTGQNTQNANAPIFALSPALVNTTSYINYSTTEGMKSTRMRLKGCLSNTI